MPLIIALLTLFLATLLLFHNRRTQPGSVWFAGSLTVIALLNISHHLVFSGDSVFWIAVTFNHLSPLYYLLGPFLFFFTRATLSDGTRLQRRDTWHFIPFLIQLLGIMPYFLKPWAFKVMVAEEMMRDVHSMVRLQELVAFPVAFNMVLLPLTWIGYTGYSLFLVIRFIESHTRGKRTTSDPAKTTMGFMVSFLLVCLATELSYTALTVEFFMKSDMKTPEFVNTPWTGIAAIGTAAIPFLLLLYPQLLYGLSKTREAKTVPSAAVLKVVPTQTSQRSEDPVIGEVGDEKCEDSIDINRKFRDLADRIPKEIGENRLYLDPDFNLDALANHLQVPKHQLYHCFSEILQTRFTRMRMEFRVRYAQRLIEQGETRTKTLEAIGMESGFSSRSAFLVSFREVTGMSPRDYDRVNGGSQPTQKT